MVKGRKKSHIVGEFKAGFSFGEMALLHDAKRRATIVCKTFSEFLRVDKPDFEEVSKKQQQQEWNIRLQCLKTWPEFSTWSDADLAMAADASRTVEFKPNDVIFSKVTHKLDDVYFLIKGECVIAREMTIYSVILPDKTRRITDCRFTKFTEFTVLQVGDSKKQKINPNYPEMHRTAQGNGEDSYSTCWKFLWRG
eukprot:m.152366 g.152366  ORF g.152366 m.152366 type:complete len:195 (+) comp38588_c0_seq2:1466-2050(+)